MTRPQIATLPLAEKIELMESLWDSICHAPAVASVIPEGNQDVLTDRVARLDSGEEPVSTWDEAKKRILDHAGKQ